MNLRAESGVSAAHDDHDLSGKSQEIHFKAAFADVPHISAALAGFRCGPGGVGQPSCFIEVVALSKKGFTYIVRKGAAPTDIYDVWVSWIAVGQ